MPRHREGVRFARTENTISTGLYTLETFPGCDAKCHELNIKLWFYNSINSTYIRPNMDKIYSNVSGE